MRILQPILARSNQLIRTAWYILVAAIALYLVVYSLGHSEIIKNAPVSAITNMLDDVEPTPYINRVLLPVTSDIVAFLTPQTLQEDVRQGVMYLLQTDTFRSFLKETQAQGFSPHLFEPRYAYRIIICVLLMYASVIVYGLMLYRLSQYFFPGMVRVAYATSLFGLIALLPMITNNFKLYDFPTVTLSALCLFTLCQQKWRPYILCFTLACFNKETAFLQTLLFLLLYGCGNNRTQRHVLIAQCIIYVAALFFVRMVVVPVQGINIWFTPLKRIADSMWFFDTDKYARRCRGLLAVVQPLA